MSTVREYLEHAAATGKTRSQAARDLGLKREDVAAYVREYDLDWPTRKGRVSARLQSVKSVMYAGVELTIAELASITDTCPDLIRHRIALGWTAEDAVTIPKRAYKKKAKPCIQS